MENKIQLTKDEIIMGFVASCVEDVADTLGVDYSAVYQRMDAVKMIDEYIIPNYEVLHSESSSPCDTRICLRISYLA